MVTEIILAVFVIVTIAYFGILIYSARERNRLCDQAGYWNEFRESLWPQANEDIAQVAALSTSLHQKYPNEAPYADQRREAFILLDGISTNANRILHDKDTRPPIRAEKSTTSGGAIWILPLRDEIRKRENWWLKTKRLQTILSQNQDDFQKVRDCQQNLEAIGGQVRNRFLGLNSQANNLAHGFADFESQVQIPELFKKEITRLQGVRDRIDQILQKNLTDASPLPTQVASVYSELIKYENIHSDLKNILDDKRRQRQQSKKILTDNESILTEIDQFLSSEEKASRPTPKIRAALEGEQRSWEELRQQRTTGEYQSVEQAAKEQEQRLTNLKTEMQAIIQERLRLQEIYDRGEIEVPATEAWINTTPVPFDINQTSQLLEAVAKQQFKLYQAIRSIDDLPTLKRLSYTDPQELVVARDIFDRKKQEYEALYQYLEQATPKILTRTANAIRNLRGQHANYLQNINLASLRNQALSLRSSWEDARNQPQIKESHIDQAIANLRQIKQLTADISASCEEADKKRATIQHERSQAQKALDHPRFDELHQEMQIFSQDEYFSSASQAGEYAAAARRLAEELEKIDTDFGAHAKASERLLTQMEALFKKYQRQCQNKEKEYRTLIDKLTSTKSDLEAYQEHLLSVIRGKVRSPITDIDEWLQIKPKASVQNYMIMIDQGQSLQNRASLLLKEIAQDEKGYNASKAKAETCIKTAKSAIAEAEDEFRKTPWGVYERNRRHPSTQQPHPDLEYSYQYLKTAEDVYQDIVNPEVEYAHSLEKINTDLVERVCQYANRAKDEAQKLRQQTRDNINDIEQKGTSLGKLLEEGNQLIGQIDDTGIAQEWHLLFRKYDRFENELERCSSYNEASNDLDQALLETRFLIQQMDKFRD